VGGVAAWLRERVPVSGDSIRALTNEPVPDHLRRWWFCLGGTALHLFVVQIVTGILLAVYYQPTASGAYESVRYITDEVAFGWFVRSIHKWAATFMIAAIILHQMRVFFSGAYRRPRELNWIVGMFLLLCTLLLGFTGYSLVFEQLSYWGATVGSNITDSLPLVGGFFKRILLGGEAYNAHTLSRFFILHGAILPATMVVLLATHISLIRLHGVSEIGDGEREKEKGTFRFFPDHVLTELAIGLVLMIMLCVLATVFPALLGEKADPFTTPSLIKPEWYFYVTYRWLKLLPGLVAILSMGFFVFLMIVWPFIDGWVRRRRPRSRFSLWVGILGVVLITGMTVWEAVAAH